MSVSILVLIVASLSAMLYIDGSSARLERAQVYLDEGRLRNGFGALSDIRRANEVLYAANLNGSLSAQQQVVFAEMLHIMRYRARLLDEASSLGGDGDLKAQVIREMLFALADLGRRVRIADPSELGLRMHDFRNASNTLRRTLIVFLYNLRRTENEVIAAQSATLAKNKYLLISVLAALTCLGVLSLLLLRREVLSRKARDKAEARNHYLACYDPITGLMNRVLFQDKVGDALGFDGKAALLFTDIHGFKALNDSHGPQTGDLALKHVARILQREAEVENGFAARVGGDEFAIFVCTDRRDVLRHLGDRIRTRLAEPVEKTAGNIRVSVSMGIATTSQIRDRLACDYSALARVAEFALLAAKRDGGERFTFYDNEVERRFLERRAMLEELPAAVENGDLEVFLQPKFDLAHERVGGFEALARWRRNDSLVPPDAFIQIAEEGGLIAGIDCFVLDEATRLVAEWNRWHKTSYSLSVNLSAVHFSNNRIVERLRRALSLSGLEPACLTIEITESVQIHDWERVSLVLKAFREIGCRISIDDFGTGYSSLAYLAAIDADELKIDRSLLTEIEESDAARFVLDAVADLAANFGMDLVAEGVETLAQARIVRDLGVGYVQGYLVGAPMPAVQALTRSADLCVEGLSPLRDRPADQTGRRSGGMASPDKV